MNVREAGAKVHWSGVAGSAATLTTTLADGRDVKTTVKFWVAPASMTVEPPPATVMPARMRVKVLDVPILKIGRATSLAVAVTVYEAAGAAGAVQLIVQAPVRVAGPLVFGILTVALQVAVANVPPLGVGVMTTV